MQVPIKHLVTLAVVAATAVLTPRSAHAQLAVATNTVHERVAKPGERYEGSIEIRNTTAEPQEALVYQTDYHTTADGQSFFDKPGTHRRSNARWVSFNPTRLVIPPNGRGVVTYAVAVPAQGVSPGTSWSILMVQAVPRGSVGASGMTPRQAQAMITSQVRFGVQIATHVGTDVPMRIAFDRVGARADSAGSRQLVYDFENTGTRGVRLLMAVELFTLDGRLVRKLEEQRGLLYPGTSARQRFDFGKLPPGEYRALVTADAGSDEIFGAQYTLRF